MNVTWVLYDIADDRARTRVAKFCKQAGLYRVQLSCFLGRLSRNEADELQLKIGAEIEAEMDKVYVFPMTKQQLRDAYLLGQAFDERLITDEVRALWL